MKQGQSHRTLNSISARIISWPLLLAIIAYTCGTPATAMTTDEFLDELQERAFLYFWHEANPDNGLVRDRNTPWAPGKMAATGFGLTGVCIGIDHGWVTREQGRDRILTALWTLWDGSQGPEPDGNIGYQGFFYHFVDFETATRTWDSELSPIDTAILFAGIIDAREYFDTDEPIDVELRTLADAITERANWNFFYNGLGIPIAWTPETGFAGYPTWLGYNEAMIMYLLAIGSPTHPIPPSAWFTWTAGYDWSTHYGYSYVVFPPLFGHQYSHCWIDFRNLQDVFMASKGITYFENSRRATLAQRAYCIDNPFGWDGYGENVWGLTASDDPSGYLAHGAPPPQHENGTLTPTAVASSLPFAPEVVIPALHQILDTYGSQLWSTYGFKDAFNPTQDWVATDYIGIDQGPIVLMIENYRNQSVWNRFMENEDVQRGLNLAGFQTVTGVPAGSHHDRDSVAAAPGASSVTLHSNSPNPFNPRTVIHFEVPVCMRIDLTIHDVSGRLVRVLLDQVPVPAGHHRVTWNGLDARGHDASSGVYFYRIAAGDHVRTRRMLLMR